MKLKNLTLAATLLVIATIIFGCSNSDEPREESPLDGGSPMAMAEMFSRGEISGTLHRANYSEYERKNGSGSSWKKIDLEGLCGGSVKPFASNFYMQDSGCLLEYFSSIISSGYGPSRLANAWGAYCDRTMHDWQIYIKCPLVYSGDRKCLKIGVREFVIDLENDKGLRLSQYGMEGTKETRRSADYIWKKDRLPLGDANRTLLIYDNLQEMYSDVLTRLRDFFGDHVDVNPSLYPDVILDNPVVDFDKLEEELKKEAIEFCYM